jgi:DNA-binding CsgD family transcriptional regulator
VSGVTEQPRETEVDRNAHRRADYVQQTTILAHEEALVLAYSEQGLSDRTIARKLDLDHSTVETHLERVVARFGPIVAKHRIDIDPTHDLEPVPHRNLSSWPGSMCDRFWNAVDKHPDVAPEWCK